MQGPRPKPDVRDVVITESAPQTPKPPGSPCSHQLTVDTNGEPESNYQKLSKHLATINHLFIVFQTSQ